MTTPSRLDSSHSRGPSQPAPAIHETPHKSGDASCEQLTFSQSADSDPKIRALTRTKQPVQPVANLGADSAARRQQSLPNVNENAPGCGGKSSNPMRGGVCGSDDFSSQAFSRSEVVPQAPDSSPPTA